MTIYERIKLLREEQGLSQQALAEKVGFKTASAINKIELGLRDINQTKVLAFAKALNTTPSYLMGWEDMDLADIKKSPEHSAEFNELVKLFENASPELRSAILSILKSQIKESKQNDEIS